MPNGTPGPATPPPNKPKPKPKTFDFFYGNITSLSNHASKYVFCLPKRIKGLALVELHKQDKLQVTNKFRHNYFTSYFNPAEPSSKSSSGTHGGELVATRAHTLSNPIEPDLLDHIASHFGAPLRFAACLVRFKDLTLIFLTCYLWDSEGLSERNNIILTQINMLVHILNLPIVCFGDFNLKTQEFLESGWCEKLRVQIIYPNLSSTISTSSNRDIDFGFISTCVKSVYLYTQPILSVPFSPHYGFVVSLSARPRSVQGLVHCIPKSLPIQPFLSTWNEFTPIQQQTIYNDSLQQAQTMLNKQKAKTGIAILGSPTNCLVEDPKFSGELLTAQILNGQKLALAALAAELTILNTLKVPLDQQHKYIGRSQYPKFKLKPLVQKQQHITSTYACPHACFWGAVKGAFNFLTSYLPAGVSTSSTSFHFNLSQVPDFISRLRELLGDAPDLCELMPDELRASVPLFTRCLDLRYLSSSIAADLKHRAQDIFSYYLTKLNNKISLDFIKYVKGQLAKGGGRLFKYISQLEKQIFKHQLGPIRQV